MIYGFGKDTEDAEHGWNWRKRYNRRPSIEEIRAEITNTIKAKYAEVLRKGFVWNGKPVEYTEERKSDFTGLLVAMQGDLLELPIPLNLGKYEDGSPVFHIFDNAADIAAVAQGIAAHKTVTAQAEWAEAKALDLTEYEIEQ